MDSILYDTNYHKTQGEKTIYYIVASAGCALLIFAAVKGYWSYYNTEVADYTFDETMATDFMIAVPVMIFSLCAIAVALIIYNMKRVANAPTRNT